MDAAETELRKEQHYQESSREALSHMREQSLKLAGSITRAAGDKLTAQLLEASYARRVAALDPPPGVPLFFGAMTRDSGEKQYVGRRHVRDDNNDILVMDWRAPASGDFYRATPADRRAIDVRRRFGHADGTLTAFEDEPLESPAAGREQMLSAIALAEIERPRSGPMRDIVATIQADQDALVRADLTTNLVVQGGPGTGKTAVGLHRAAYLLYANDKRLERSGVLIIGPNDRFIDYIAAVLPALGEVAVTQTTLPRLIGASDAAAARMTAAPADAAESLRHDARLAEVCRRALLGLLGPPDDELKLVVDGRIVRLPARLLTTTRDGVLARGLAFEPSRKLFLARVAQEAADRSGHTMTAARGALRDAAAAARLNELWPRVRPETLLRSLVGTPEVLASAAGGILDASEQELLLTTDLRPAALRIGSLVLIDELRWLLERGESFGHVVVDEAQDLSPMMLRAVARRRGLSMTLLGDIAQGTTPWAADSWAGVARDLGLEHVEQTALDLAFRSTAPIVAIANRLLPLIADGVPLARPVRSGAAPAVTAADDLGPAIAREVTRLLSAAGTVGVISCSATLPDLVADDRVSVLPLEAVKGLEFDSVLLVEPAAAFEAHPPRTALRHLYVALTRAVSQLAIVHSRPLPDVLASAL